MCSCSFTGTCQRLLSISLEDFGILCCASVSKVHVWAEEKLPFHKLQWWCVDSAAGLWQILMLGFVMRRNESKKGQSRIWLMFLHTKNFHDGVPGVTINIIKCVQMLTFQTSLAIVLEKVSYCCSTEMLNSSPLEFSNHWGWDFAFHRKQGFWRKDWYGVRGLGFS